MSQIPAFLRALAALIRELVRTGRAVHVTAKTAAELHLLAGLPWKDCRYEKPHADLSGTESGIAADIFSIQPADIAHGWLRAAHPFPSVANPADVYYSFEEPRDYVIEATRRAAECAELCALASSWSNWSGAVNEATKTETLTYHTAKPHDGTIEGARTVWSFVVEQVRLKLSIAEKGFLVGETDRGKVNLCTNGPAGLYQHRKQQMAEIRDTYRRELEAMKC